ncbi:MAG TPA: SLC13 family permease [Acetobacteraceae bacterium]|nr:SLC13 family permease [Acetobacteraceae bacterium]
MELGSTQSILILGTFAVVIAVIASDLLDIAVTALLGVCFLLVTGALDGHDLMTAMASGGESLALLFGGMVVVRVLMPTGIFELAGYYFARAVAGSGKRYLIGLILLIAPICAFLPNATTVLLTAPIIIGLARGLGVGFEVPVILCALVGNTAGILTLVGDPATYIVGSSIGLGFNGYLRHGTPGALLTLAAIVPVLPFVARDIWHTQRAPEVGVARRPEIKRPWLVAVSLAVLALMIALFLVGPLLPVEVVPPAAAILCATLALLLVNSTHVEEVERVLADLDWTTLVFLACIFVLVAATSKTGIFDGLSRMLYAQFGTELPVVALAILLIVFAVSAFVANIPLVLAMTFVVKGYFVVSSQMPELAAGAGFGAWPQWTYPAFIGLTFGATLGGGATMVGDSSNIVACGICNRAGGRVTFGRFLQVGLPISLAQLVVAAAYVEAMRWIR